MKVLITGGASGIGFDTAIMLARNNHDVYLTVHRFKQVESVLERVEELSLSNRITCFVLDITNEKDRKKIYDLEIDCLICNGAIGIGGAILNLPVSEIRTNFEVNVFSNIEMIQEYVASLFLSKRPGKVIIISSIAANLPIPLMGSYCASKAALSSLIRILRREVSLIDKSLKIHLIEPGIYETGFNKVMFDNKYLYDDKFFPYTFKVDKYQTSIFKFIGSKSTKSVVKKVVKVTTTDNNRFLYRVPFMQMLGNKIYTILWK